MGSKWNNMKANFSMEDISYCYDNIFYLLSYNCIGDNCKACRYRIKTPLSCVKNEIRKLIGHASSDHMLTTCDEVDSIMDMIRQSCIEECNMTGKICCSGKCPFKPNPDIVCKRIKVREWLD